MTNEQIVELIRTGADNDLLLSLWYQCEVFIRQQARKLSGYAEMEDLMQQGYLILNDAAMDYRQGVRSFASYLADRLVWGWARWLSETGSMIRLPVYMARQVQQYKRLQRAADQAGEDAPEGFICRSMGIDGATLQLIKQAALQSHTASLNKVITTENGSAGELQDIIDCGNDFTDEVIDRVQRDELAAVLWGMVDEKLEDRQAEVIKKQYQEGKTLTECAEEMGANRRELQNDNARAFRVLRQPGNRKKLLPFLDEIRSYSMHGTGVNVFNQSWTSATERVAFLILENDPALTPKIFENTETDENGGKKVQYIRYFETDD